MASSQPFIVRFRFVTPVAVGSHGLLPALDALLASQVASRQGMLAPPPRTDPCYFDLPLEALTPDCWAASLLFPTQVPEDGCTELYRRTYSDPQWHGRSLTDFSDVRASEVHNGSSGPFVTHFRPVDSLLVPEAVAYGRGDPRAVQTLLSKVDHIGAQRGIGYGLLKEPPIVQRISRDVSLRDPHDGKLMRIVPLRSAADLGLDPGDGRLRAMVTRASSRPPLWFRPWWEPCLVPLPLSVRYRRENVWEKARRA